MNVAATYNVMSLCAGVGGLDLGIRIAVPGARSVCLVEREAYAAAVLGARMEEGWLHPAPIWLGDIGAFDPAPWRGRVHCIASGDPCQPNSVAGKRQGADDDRWLIDQVLRIVDGVRPDRVFRENVPGNADGQLAALVPPLEAMGYRVAAGIFAAAEAEASHRRERLFIMADRAGESRRIHARQRQPGEGATELGGTGGAVGNALGRSDGRIAPDERRQAIERNAVDGAGNGRVVGLADACGAGLEGREQRGPSGERHGAEASRSATELRGTRMEHTQGLGRGEGRAEHELWSGRNTTADASLPLFAPGPSDPLWTDILRRAPQLEPAVRRVADGMAHRVDRLRAGGNGVVSLAAAYAWRTLEARLQEF